MIMYNYDNAENNGYYRIDDYEYGSKIELIPQEPKRNGYTFVGWYKEPECINKWNFDTDTLTEERIIDGVIKYQETKLYAEWNIN